MIEMRRFAWECTCKPLTAFEPPVLCLWIGYDLPLHQSYSHQMEICLQIMPTHVQIAPKKQNYFIPSSRVTETPGFQLELAHKIPRHHERKSANNPPKLLSRPDGKSSMPSHDRGCDLPSPLRIGLHVPRSNHIPSQPYIAPHIPPLHMSPDPRNLTIIDSIVFARCASVVHAPVSQPKGILPESEWLCRSRPLGEASFPNSRGERPCMKRGVVGIQATIYVACEKTLPRLL